MNVSSRHASQRNRECQTVFYLVVGFYMDMVVLYRDMVVVLYIDMVVLYRDMVVVLYRDMVVLICFRVRMTT